MSQFYPTGLAAILGAFFGNQAPGVVVQLYAAGVDAGYVFDASHQTAADLGDEVVAQAVEITNAGINGAAVGGDDVQFTGLIPGDTATYIVIFAGWTDTDNNDQSQLICLLDHTSCAALPLVFQGDVANVVWNAAGIFKIG